MIEIGKGLRMEGCKEGDRRMEGGEEVGRMEGGKGGRMRGWSRG
jgi:hypothetical protein